MQSSNALPANIDGVVKQPATRGTKEGALLLRFVFVRLNLNDENTSEVESCSDMRCA